MRHLVLLPYAKMVSDYVEMLLEGAEIVDSSEVEQPRGRPLHMGRANYPTFPLCVPRNHN